MTEPLTLILHAGPMKTGSTALQDMLREQASELQSQGILYRFYDGTETISERLGHDIDDARGQTARGLIVSSEFLCFKKAEVYQRAFFGRNVDAHAVLVHRPLKKTYVSLYLQNLKGPVARVSNFEKFVDQQMVKDVKPEADQGTVYNYQFLNDNLSSAGLSTHWLAYSRDNLLKDFCALLSELTKVGLHLRPELKSAAPQGLSPRRSLNMALAQVAREVNRVFKAKTLSPKQRSALMLALLDISEEVSGSSESFVDAALLDRIERFDHEINGDFYGSVQTPRG